MHPIATLRVIFSFCVNKLMSGGSEKCIVGNQPKISNECLFPFSAVCTRQKTLDGNAGL